MKAAILDTGPLVAWLCPRDEHHVWARRTFAEIAPGSLVCEAVLTEVCHLVAKEGVGRAKVIEFVLRVRLRSAPVADELIALRALLDQYADAPMDFADACIVRLAELHPDSVVCTTDGHFRFFRKNGHETIELLSPAK
jgi:uncharacterized protein